ncbi:MAG: excinuclease ABC subunit A [Paracoccaceae bacterium]
MARRLFWNALVALAIPLVLTAGSVPAQACPPGLAKKDPPCVPPGQVGRNNGDDHGHENDGDFADLGDLFYLDDYPRYGLAPLPFGQRYAVVDDQIVVIDAETYEVLQLIRLFTALTD